MAEEDANQDTEAGTSRSPIKHVRYEVAATAISTVAVCKGSEFGKILRK